MIIFFLPGMVTFAQMALFYLLRLKFSSLSGEFPFFLLFPVFLCLVGQFVKKFFNSPDYSSLQFRGFSSLFRIFLWFNRHQLSPLPRKAEIPLQE